MPCSSAEAVLLTKDLKFSSHRSVISLFGEHFVKRGIFDQKLGRAISGAFEKRLIGDYSFVPKISGEAAREVLSDAHEFVEAIREYLRRANIRTDTGSRPLG